ncbi:MAG TPA: Hint domain-containing protein [Rhodopila sp.]|nr:Hint domain-containing protein [Rhodopila sp.]
MLLLDARVSSPNTRRVPMTGGRGTGGTSGTTCYKDGTQIRTPFGESPIESIEAGDEVVVRRDGQDVYEPVKWVGHTKVDLRRNPYLEDVAPIRVRAHAIASDEPRRDLFVSPEHCLILDGFCVAAKLLVNGGSIVSERDHAPFTYYHLELEQHGILIAENALAESYLDTGNRSLFDNGPAPHHLHPRFVVNANAARWKTDACAPLVENPEDLARIWTRLAERSEQIGYPVSRPKLVNGADAHLIIDGRMVRPVSDSDGKLVFTVPANAQSIRLVSRFCIPADKMQAEVRDTRRLGLRVSSIAISADGLEAVIPADHPDLSEGWYDAERDEASLWRWTDGDAVIPWTQTGATALLTISASPVDAYPVYDEKLRLAA